MCALRFRLPAGAEHGKRTRQTAQRLLRLPEGVGRDDMHLQALRERAKAFANAGQQHAVAGEGAVEVENQMLKRERRGFGNGDFDHGRSLLG